MPWQPPHRVPVDLPGPWPACAQGMLRQGAAWLHSGQRRPGDEGGDFLVLPGGPRLEARWEGRWTCRLDGREVPGSPWEALAGVLGRHPFPWVGAASFEACCAEAGLPFQAPEAGSLGLSWQGAPRILRVREGRAELWTWTAPENPSALAATLAASCALGRGRGALAPRWGQAQHRSAVLEIQRRILEGDFYVANLCAPLEGPFEGDALTFALAALRRARPPYGAYLPVADGHLLCLSMERILSRRGDRLATEPIKGSAPITGEADVDAAAGMRLLADPKERAEHTMIVDLLRNDLGRIARSGSVEVERLMGLEPFPTVQHLVSRVAATLRPGTDLPALLRSVLPGGSVTGAPKHAVCAHLARTEAGPRGFYCGALGWILPEGDLDLCLPIRTAHLDGGRIRYWTGGGITRRSDPDREWQELFLKAKVLEGLVDLPAPAQ